jgi:hypothetical protein
VTAPGVEVLKDRDIGGKTVRLMTVFGAWFIADEFGAVARSNSRNAIVDWALEQKQVKGVETLPKPDFRGRDET